MRRDAGVRGYQYPWLHWTRADHVFVFRFELCLSARALYAECHPVQTNHLGVDGLARSAGVRCRAKSAAKWSDHEKWARAVALAAEVRERAEAREQHQERLREHQERLRDP